jgi:putative ABC transport system ATP-binding protein
MKTPVLELSHVYKSYTRDGESVDILKDISIKIDKGDFIAIMGPSGSGKSTLMYLVGCLDLPSKGKIMIDGEDISADSEKQLAKIRNQKIGFVFQMFNLLPKTSALANVLLPVIYSKKSMIDAKKKAIGYLERFNLSHRIDHFPNQMSGGEQQRVAIARALINNPSIILADEPTGNLDSKSGQEIMNVLSELHKEGNTIIMVTHDQNVANMAERIIRIQDGRIVGNN